MWSIDFFPGLFIPDHEYSAFQREFWPGQIISVGKMCGYEDSPIMQSEIFVRIVSKTSPKKGFFKFQDHPGEVVCELPDGRQMQLFKAKYYTDDAISVFISYGIDSLLFDSENQIADSQEKSLGVRVTTYDDNLELTQAMSNLQTLRQNYQDVLRRRAQEEAQRVEAEKRQAAQYARDNEAAGQHINELFRKL